MEVHKLQYLKDIVFRLANSDPKKPLTPSQIALIQQRLLSFPVFPTPTHPTYSVMIESAIEELNEENGSNEESISEYIRLNFDGLPWAHDVYLSHHLSKLCQSGELVCSSSRCYTKPTLIQRRKSGRKRKRRLTRKRKEHLIEEGISGGVVEVDEVSQEEDILVSEGNLVKRRRRSLVFDEDDEEVGVSSTQKLVGEKCDEASVLQDGDVVIAKACQVSEEWQGIGTGGEDHDPVNVSEEQLVVDGFERKLELEATECQYEVGNPVLPLDDDVCKVVIEPGFLSSVGEVHSECKEEVTAEKVNLHDDRDASKLPVECVEKSSFDTPSGSIVRVDAPELAVKESVLAVNEVLISPPCEGNTTLSAVSGGMNPIPEKVDPTIICGLTHPLLDQPQRMHKVYYPKKRLKAYREKMKISLAADQNQLEHNQLHKLSFQGGLETKPCATLLESPKLKEFPVGQSRQACTPSLLEELERQKCLNSSHHASSLEKLMSVEDDENLPLQQVLEKCGKQKKNALQILKVKSPLETEAPSTSGSKLQVNLPNSINMGMTPIIVPELILTAEKQWPQQQQQRELKPQDQKHCNFEADIVAVTASKTLSPLQIEKGRNRHNHEDQEPLILVTENVDIVHQHRQEGQGIRGRTRSALYSQEGQGQHTQHQSKKRKKGSRGRPRKHMKAAKGNAVAFSNTHHEEQEGSSEPLISQHSQLQIKKPKKYGQGRSEKQIEATEEDKPASLNFHFRPQEGSSELAISDYSQQTVKLQIEDGQGRLQKKKAGRGRPRKQPDATNKDVAAPTYLHLHQQEESSEPPVNQHSQQQTKLLKKDHRGGPLEQVETPKEDGAASSNLHLQQLAGSSEPPSLQKKKSRGRPRKQKEGAIKDATASANLLIGEQERESESATHQLSQLRNKQLKKDSRGRLGEQEVHKEDSAAPSTLLHQLEEGLSPDDEPKELQSESCGAPEILQVMLPSDDRIHSEGHLPKRRTLSTQSNDLCDDCDQQQKEQQCHEHEGTQEKFEGQSRLCKEKLGKITAIEVPLSSKDQLRSRIKRQSQDST